MVSNLAITFDVITMILTGCMCVVNYKRLTQNTRFLIYYIFVFFYVLPIFLDYLYMFPSYTYSDNVAGFRIPNADTATRVVYDIVVLLVQALLLWAKTKKEEPISLERAEEISTRLKVIMYIGMVAATVAVLFMGRDKSILYTFMWRENAETDAAYVPLAEKLSYIGICCAAILFFLQQKKNRFIRRILCIVFAYVNLCIEGKRSIIFFLCLAVFVVVFPGIRNKQLSAKERRKMLFGAMLLLILTIVVMIVSTIIVKTENRGYTGVESVYTSIRIDIFRDDRVRMAIYSLLNPEKLQILEYPGQTLFPAIINAFPLDYIFGFLRIRPMAYTAYLSAALVGSSVVTQEAAFMSPTIFAELFSNFHVLGLAFFVMFSLWVARKAEKFPYPANVFIIVSYILLQMYSSAYMAYFLELTVILCLFYSVRFRLSGRVRY